MKSRVACSFSERLHLRTLQVERNVETSITMCNIDLLMNECPFLKTVSVKSIYTDLIQNLLYGSFCMFEFVDSL